jgi:uncharacterized protein
MRIVGRVQSLWRYPVKSMRGEELSEAFAGYGGVYGDRCWAFLNAVRPGFPYLTAREKQSMLLYTPTLRNADSMRRPPNAAEAESIGATPLYAEDSALHVDVRTPHGESIPIDDPRLIESLSEKHCLTLHRSQRAMTDCRPISLFSCQTANQLSEETGTHVDLRRFRANVYLNLEEQKGFAENEFVGRTVRIGSRVEVAVMERDPRCKMITLDPDTGEANPEVMKVVARDHDGTAGVYGVVLVEGIMKSGDEVILLG